MKKDRPGFVDKSRVAQAFRKSGSTYEEHAVVQMGMSHHLISLLSAKTVPDFSRVLEIGCCTGYLTEQLCRNARTGTLIVNDLVAEFCHAAKQRVQKLTGEVVLLPGDIERLGVPPELDLVISSATFQWMADFPGLLQRLRERIKPGGMLCFSIFGPGTMQEIKEITGRGLSYYPLDELIPLVTKEFQLLVSDAETRVLHFPSGKAVLQHIKNTGVGGTGKNSWTRSTLANFDLEYRARFGCAQGLPVTYVSHYIIAAKRGAMDASVL